MASGDFPLASPQWTNKWPSWSTDEASDSTLSADHSAGHQNQFVLSSPWHRDQAQGFLCADLVDHAMVSLSASINTPKSVHLFIVCIMIPTIYHGFYFRCLDSASIFKWISCFGLPNGLNSSTCFIHSAAIPSVVTDGCYRWTSSVRMARRTVPMASDSPTGCPREWPAIITVDNLGRNTKMLAGIYNYVYRQREI